MTLYIGIDISFTTAMVTCDNIFIYALKSDTRGKLGGLNSNYKKCSELKGVVLREFERKSLSKTSISDRFKHSSDVGKALVSDILNIKKQGGYSNIIVAIEDYSYGSTGRHTVIVEYATIIRKAIVDIDDCEVFLVSPSSLKRSSGMMAYDPEINKQKKIYYRNGKGISSGSFKKHDMMNCILDIKDKEITNDIWHDFIKENQEKLTNMKSIPKPIEDINDAYLLHKVIKYNFKETKLTK